MSKSVYVGINTAISAMEETWQALKIQEQNRNREDEKRKKKSQRRAGKRQQAELTN